MSAPRLVTERLTLRGFAESDLEPFAAMNRDPRVMEFLGPALTRGQSDDLARRLRDEWDGGYGIWALEDPATGAFLGFTGFHRVGFDAAFTPAVEIGWRLRANAWGQGFATEAASAALAWAPGRLDPPRGEIVSFTAVVNERSRAVMGRLGLTHDPADDFDHPRVADGPLRRHVLYRGALGAPKI